MRILIEATAAGEGRGGVVTYVRELLRAWAAADFGDELLVAGSRNLPAAIDEAVGSAGGVVRLGPRLPGARLAVQHVGIPALTLRWKPDVVLATTPVVPLLHPARPVAVVLYDLRHLSRPAEFGRSQRAYRALLYRLGLRRASRILAISRTTERDVARRFPSVRDKTVAIHLGADHLPDGPADGPAGRHAIAFAHWPNKQPDVSIRTWARVRRRVDGLDWILHVVGVHGGERERLAAIASAEGVADLVELHAYLAEPAFRALFASAGLVLMPSTFEGFGLPVLEAMRLGVAVVASDDAAIREVGGPWARYAPAGDPDALATEAAHLIEDDELRLRLVDGGSRHARGFTWRRTAEQTRAVLADLVQPPAAPREF